MTNKNAQDWLNEKYPVDKVCKRTSDKENNNRKRDVIFNLNLTQSTIHKGKITLIGKLQLVNFSKLTTLRIVGNDIDELDISQCLNLEKLDISYNKNIKELDLSKNSSLIEVNLQGCQSLKIEKIISHLKFDEKTCKLVEKSKIETPISPAEDKVRNILIIGMTGSGKSSLSNTLTNTNIFESGNQSISLTKYFKSSKEFDWEFNSNHYKFKVIDNIGFGDSQGEDFTEQILYRIGEGIKEIEGEINQILFLIRGRFDPSQIKMFNLFKGFINESEITKFTTIIMTGFENYLNKKEVSEDKEKLLKENSKIKDLIESCNEILYVNNPGIDQKGKSQEESDSFQLDRSDSREIILNHLAKNCNQIYKLKEWKSIKFQVDNCLLSIKEINNQIRKIENNSGSDQSEIDSLNQKKKSTIFDFFRSIGKIRAEKVSVKGAVGFNFGVVTTNFELNLENLAVKENNYNQIIEEYRN